MSKKYRDPVYVPTYPDKDKGGCFGCMLLVVPFIGAVAGLAWALKDWV